MTVLEKVCGIKMEQSTFDDIQDRADKRDLTVSEYIRKSVRLVRIIEDLQQEEGDYIVIRRKDGTELMLMVVW